MSIIYGTMIWQIRVASYLSIRNLGNPSLEMGVGIVDYIYESDFENLIVKDQIKKGSERIGGDQRAYLDTEDRSWCKR